MTLQWSTTVRNARLAAWAAAVGPGPIVRIYEGTIPGTCATVLGVGVTMLAEFELPSTWMATASGGLIEGVGLPVEASVSEDGTAEFYRLYANGGIICHEQGTVVLEDEVGDMQLSDLDLKRGMTLRITGYSKTEPGE